MAASTRVRTFSEIYGRQPDVAESAPGRVNLIGEHTDYHGGLVLPAVIPQRTSVELARRGDRRVVAWTTAAPEEAAAYELGTERRQGRWIDYVQAVTHAWPPSSPPLAGFDLWIDSSVPVGSGLSSSAALEIAVLRALRRAFDADLDDVALARIAHRAETAFVGAPVGIMDQFACSVGRPDEALFLDTLTLDYDRIPIPAEMELVVLNSGVRHEHATGEYAIRRRESFEAAHGLDLGSLRDAGLTDLTRIEALPSPLNRRARHVVTENARVQSAAHALRGGLLSALGVLFNASHRSMRIDYEVSTPEIDALVDIAQADPHVYGARLTGGGFGGCIVAVADTGAGASAASRVLQQYEARTGRTGTRVLPPPAAHD
jgi:galactokinase